MFFFIANRQAKVVKLRDLYMRMSTAFGMTSLSYLFHQIHLIIYKHPDYNSPLIYWWGYCNLSISYPFKT